MTDITLSEADVAIFKLGFDRMADAVHANSRDKGFWDVDRNDGEALMLMVSELAEGLEALRHGNAPSDKIEGFLGIEEELADCIIRIAEFSAGRKWRVAEAVIAKMLYNATRPHKHGKAF